jgi:ketosteroid isomerase-like protein
MSQEIVEALRAEYAAMSRKDWNAVLTTAHQDFELKTPSEGLDDGIVRGVENTRRAFEEFFGPYDELTVEPESFFEGDDQIVVFFLQRARPAGSSAFIERRAAHLWTLRDGKVVRLEIFPQRAKALEAAGLSEHHARTDF